MYVDGPIRNLVHFPVCIALLLLSSWKKRRDGLVLGGFLIELSSVTAEAEKMDGIEAARDDRIADDLIFIIELDNHTYTPPPDQRSNK